MQFLGDSLDDSNFKDTVARTPDQQAKHDAYEYGNKFVAPVSYNGLHMETKAGNKGFAIWRDWSKNVDW